MIDRDSCACFICGSPDICEHREFELIPYWRRLRAVDRIRRNRTPVNPRSQRVATLRVALPTRKPAQRAISRSTHDWTGTRWRIKTEFSKSKRIRRKAPASAQSTAVGESLAQVERPRAAGGSAEFPSSYSALRGW